MLVFWGLLYIGFLLFRETSMYAYEYLYIPYIPIYDPILLHSLIYPNMPLYIDISLSLSLSVSLSLSLARSLCLTKSSRFTPHQLEIHCQDEIREFLQEELRSKH